MLYLTDFSVLDTSNPSQRYINNYSVKNIHSFIGGCVKKREKKWKSITMKRSSSDWLSISKFCFFSVCFLSDFSISKLEMSPT